MLIYTVLSFAGVENVYRGSQVIDWTTSCVGGLQFYISATITNQMFQLEALYHRFSEELFWIHFIL
jgi:hypothetical protein